MISTLSMVLQKRIVVFDARVHQEIGLGQGAQGQLTRTIFLNIEISNGSELPL